MAVCCANIAAASRASCSLVVPGTYKRANALIKFKVFSFGEEVLGVKCGIGIVLFVLQHNNAYVAHLFCPRANNFCMPGIIFFLPDTRCKGGAGRTSNRCRYLGLPYG